FVLLCVAPLFSSHSATTTAIYTLSLHDALPICKHGGPGDQRGLIAAARVDDEPIEHRRDRAARQRMGEQQAIEPAIAAQAEIARDRKSTRLNSSHVKISYAVFCLKKKKNEIVEG